MSEALKPKHRGSLADEVCRKIADDIVLGTFAPGARLDEVSLAERFEVSRTPVREALKQLAIMGLVEMRPNRGSVVATQTGEQLDRLFEAIGELEAACARHAALRMQHEERTRMMETHEEARAALQMGDIDRYDAANLEFHATIIRGCYNPTLIEMTATLRNRVAPFRRTQFRNIERMGASFEEHCVIVEAILKHDGITAYREMRSHLLSARSAATLVSSAWSTPVTPLPSKSVKQG